MSCVDEVVSVGMHISGRVAFNEGDDGYIWVDKQDVIIQNRQSMVVCFLL
jgi:hypothetical protein